MEKSERSEDPGKGRRRIQLNKKDFCCAVFRMAIFAYKKEVKNEYC